jgi:hypothetical protein
MMNHLCDNRVSCRDLFGVNARPAFAFPSRLAPSSLISKRQGLVTAIVTVMALGKKGRKPRLYPGCVT